DARLQPVLRIGGGRRGTAGVPRDGRAPRLRRDRAPVPRTRCTAARPPGCPTRAGARAPNPPRRVTPRPDFGARAHVSDRLRPTDAAWWEAFDALVELGDLRGRRVLDVGCGTGRLAAALAEKAAAKVWGVDASPEMVAVAKESLPASVGVRRADAER